MKSCCLRLCAFGVASLLTLTACSSAASTTESSTPASAPAASSGNPSTAERQLAVESAAGGSAAPAERRPADTGGQFIPLPANVGATADEVKEACGTTITIAQGDEYALERKVTVNPNGTYTMEVRGRTTIDVTAADGRSIDEADASGSYVITDTADGYTVVSQGPSFITPEPEETPDWVKNGVPLEGIWWQAGTSSIQSTDSGRTVQFVQVPDDYVSICTLLK